MHVKANKKNKIQLYTVYKRIILKYTGRLWKSERMNENKSERMKNISFKW